MNLFLVTSPFQLICAIEAKNHFKTKNNVLIIRHERHESTLNQIGLLLNKNDWSEIIFIGRKNKIYGMWKLIYDIKKINSNLHFDNVFYADYSAWRTAVLLNNITVEREVMFDDGVGTLREYVGKIKPELEVSRNKPTRDLLLKLMGVRPPRLIYPRNKFSFFTFFNLEDCNFHVELNNFNVLKKKLNSTECFKIEAKAAFIGQGMVAEKGVKLEKYCKLLSSIIALHPQGIIYFPHRTETNIVKDAISSIPKLEYHQSSLPLELEIGEKQLKLCAIYSITSTAVVTIGKIYPDIPVWDVDVPIEHYVIKEFGENFQQVSKTLNLKKINIII